MSHKDSLRSPNLRKVDTRTILLVRLRLVLDNSRAGVFCSFCPFLDDCYWLCVYPCLATRASLIARDVVDCVAPEAGGHFL